MSDIKKFPVNEQIQPTVEFLAYGNDENLENQLITKSLQPNILKFTPKDSSGRFSDLDSYRKWQAKGRILHWLIGPNSDLAGIIWYGESEFPIDLELEDTPTYTFAIRIYDGYAGKGLAKPFMAQSLQILAKQLEEKSQQIPTIWLQTDTDNPAAISAYTKFGYEEICRDEKRVTMVLYSSKIAQLIQ